MLPKRLFLKLNMTSQDDPLTKWSVIGVKYLIYSLYGRALTLNQKNVSVCPPRCSLQALTDFDVSQ